MKLPKRMGKTREGLPRISPYLGRALGAFAGLAGGAYGLAAGLLIGSMVDEARAEGRLGRYFSDPAAPAPSENFPGLMAAAALAMRGAWLGEPEGKRRKALFLRLAEKRLGLGAGHRAGLAQILDLALGETELEPGLLGRRLALEGGPEASSLLSNYAYALLRLGRLPLDHESELALSSLLADAGIGRAERRLERAYHFPAYRDPWELLGLEPGATKAELRGAYRRLSKLRHPDIQGRESASGAAEDLEVAGIEGEAFRRLREAYEFLSL